MEATIVYWGYIGDDGNQNGNYYFILALFSYLSLVMISSQGLGVRV